MVSLKLQDFGGMIPIVSPEMLPEAGAADATDARLNSRTLRGIRNIRLIHDFADGFDYKRVFKLRKLSTQQELFYGSTDRFAEVIENPLVNDEFDRFYEIANGVPKVATWDQINAGTPFGDVTVPKPVGTLTFTPTGGPPGGADPTEDRVYLVTFQTEWGEESEPGDPTSVQLKADDTVTIDDIPQPPGTLTNRNWEKINIYRTVVGSSEAPFYFVASVAVGITTYFDETKSAVVTFNRRLDSWENEPPESFVSGTLHSSGAMVGFSGRHLWFSKPYLPHAWPASFKISLEDTIVGVAATGQEIYVMTNGRPVIVFGSTPGAMSVRTYPVYEPCIAFGSIVPTENGVVYMGDQALILFTAGGVQRITDNVVGKVEWVARFDAEQTTMSAARHFGQYIYLREPGSNGFAFSSDQDVERSIMGIKNRDSIKYFHNDKRSVAVFAIINDKVYEWHHPEEPAVPYYWKSKVFKTSDPLNFGAITCHFQEEDIQPGTPWPEIEAPADGVLINVYVDGALVWGEVIENKETRRLPSGFKSDTWQIEVFSGKIITYIGVAETAKELANV